MRDGETLDQERERAYEMLKDLLGKPKWWLRRHATKQERWLLAYFSSRPVEHSQDGV